MENIKHVFEVNIKLVLQWLHDYYKDYICEKMLRHFLWNLFAWLKSTHKTTRKIENYLQWYICQSGSSNGSSEGKKHTLLQFLAFEWLTANWPLDLLQYPKHLSDKWVKSWQIKHWNIIQKSNILLVRMTTRYNEWYILLFRCNTFWYERQTLN